MSSHPRGPVSTRRRVMARPPGSVVSVPQPDEMVPQGLRQLEHRSDLRAPRGGWPVTLVHCARDLIEIPPEGSELIHGLLEKRVLRPWERRSAAQVALRDVGKVGRRGHPPGARTLPKQPPV